ncbi:MAG TPA: cytidylate kinase-like family protein [Syntrophorhabdaceae bacterium]|nr:cytidylate kinase-like family protein [Syntrophorhabdaceae bacterium]
MWKNISTDKIGSFIERHFGTKGQQALLGQNRPAITISRQEGAGGLTVASYLAEYMQSHTGSREEWTVFSQHIVAKVLEEHKYDKRIGDFMKEDHKGSLMDSIEEFLGLHPSTWTLVEQTNDIIMKLARIGNVILVGRGANIVTSQLPNVYHVHLVGSLEKRIEQAMKVFNLDQKAAAHYIDKKDAARKRYIKDNFHRDINDPLLYHVVINTDFTAHDQAARLIGTEVITRFELNSAVRVNVRQAAYAS